MVNLLQQDGRFVRDQLLDEGEERPIYIFEYSEEALLDEATVKITETEHGHAFILGHPVNGVLGIANGEDGEQITLGAGGLGDTTLLQVVNENNTFKEMLRDDEYTDTTLTTATLNTTDHNIEF